MGIEIQILESDNSVEAARERIQTKILWLVPNWECSRPHPCGICFAQGVMADARNNGYLHASDDFFRKAQTLSSLPWREVILTGGEPTMNPYLLRSTLLSIDPQRKVRIITNGDWILEKDQREGVIWLIRESGRCVQVDISDHGSVISLSNKIEALRGKLHLGVQQRYGEHPDDRYGEKRRALINKFALTPEGHRVLGLGQPIKPDERVVVLRMEKLIRYTTDKERNVGTYLIPAKEGTRVIASHETPYLVFPTPADIANPQDSPEDVLSKVMEYYSAPSRVPKDILDRETIAYAAAAFRASVPVTLVYYELPKRLGGDREPFSLKRLRNLMAVYYQVISEKSGESVKSLKSAVARSIVDKLLNTPPNKCAEIVQIIGTPVPIILAELVPSDEPSLAQAVADRLIHYYDRSRYYYHQEGSPFLFQHLGVMADNHYRYQMSDLKEHLFIMDIPLSDLLRLADDMQKHPSSLKA